MARITYQDFNVLFARTGNEGEYSAKVFGAGGDAKITFTLAEILDGTLNEPTENDNLASRHITFAPMVNNQGNYYLMRRRPPNFDEAKRLGGMLFESVFKKSLRTAFELSRERVKMSKTFLRVRLHLTDVPELATLPWEYLYNHENNHFFAQLPGTPIVRYLNIAQPIDELLVEGALRMLVVISEPNGAQQLNVEQEWQKLQTELAPLIERKLITVERLDNATLPALQRKLLENLEDSPFHIFHFIGHGIFDRQTGAGFLLFEDNNRAGRLVSGEDLSVILKDQGLRLAVINACEGAISAQTNSYAGVAQTLCREAGIPAVLAMQFEIPNEVAITFAENFYGALTKNFPVEAALAEARKAILIIPNKVEWATPVLYMRSDDGRISKEKDEGTILLLDNDNLGLPPVPDLPPALVEHYNSVFEALRDGQLVPFVGLDANLFGRASAPETWERADGLPDSSELARYLSRKFNYPLNDLPDLARIAQYSIATNQFGDLYDEISEIFNDNINQPTALHVTIAELAAKISAEAKNESSTFLRTKDSLRRRFIVVSTGYDSLFETAFKQVVRDFHVISYVARGMQRGKFLHLRYINSNPNNRPEYINSPNDYNGLADGNPVILKLPGTVENIEPSFAITEDDYFDYLNNRELTSLLPAVVTGKLKGSNHLFLGYSPCSWNMRALLYRIWEEQRRSYRESWAILSKSQAMDETFWRACNVTIVHSDLSKYIEGLRGRAQTT